MGFLDYGLKRSISRGINRAIGTVVEDKILEAVAPNAKQNIAKNAQILNQTTEQLQYTVESYGIEASKSIKICSNCKEGAPVNMKFCPNCGAELPEITLYEQMMATQPQCSNCNTIVNENTKFCPECGAKILKAPSVTDTKFCVSCGSALAEGIKFCNECGTKV